MGLQRPVGRHARGCTGFTTSKHLDFDFLPTTFPALYHLDFLPTPSTSSPTTWTSSPSLPHHLITYHLGPLVSPPLLELGARTEFQASSGHQAPGPGPEFVPKWMTRPLSIPASLPRSSAIALLATLSLPRFLSPPCTGCCVLLVVCPLELA